MIENAMSKSNSKSTGNIWTTLKHKQKHCGQQDKTFEDITADSGKLRWAFFHNCVIG